MGRLERVKFVCRVLSVGEASLSRRVKQAIPLSIVDTVRQSQVQLQATQDATYELNLLYRLFAVMPS